MCILVFARSTLGKLVTSASVKVVEMKKALSFHLNFGEYL